MPSLRLAYVHRCAPTAVRFFSHAIRPFPVPTTPTARELTLLPPARRAREFVSVPSTRRERSPSRRPAHFSLHRLLQRAPRPNVYRVLKKKAFPRKCPPTQRRRYSPLEAVTIGFLTPCTRECVYRVAFISLPSPLAPLPPLPFAGLQKMLFSFRKTTPCFPSLVGFACGSYRAGLLYLSLACHFAVDINFSVIRGAGAVFGNYEYEMICCFMAASRRQGLSTWSIDVFGGR